MGPRWRRTSPWIKWPLAGAGALLTLLVLGGTWLWFTTSLPPAGGVGESAIVLDRNGQELAVLSQGGTRVAVQLDRIPGHVPQALLAAEDRRFYDHTGVDPLGVARAFWNNLTDDDLEGGSTITQQLVKNVYLDSDRTITRKVREAVLAVKLERSIDKEQILQRYLNTVYFGRGAYGIEAAARAYFDVHAGDLEVHQTAMLVGMLHSPESYDPVARPDDVTERRDQVIDVMAEMGSLEPDAAEAAKAEPVEVVPAPPTTSLTAGVAPHFVERIRAEVIDRLGEEVLYSQGLVIHSTLDLADQRAAEASVATHLDDPEDPQAAVVGIDRSGAVRAWVGGRDFDQLQLDLVSDDASAGRQPGSTFKPVVLTANLARGHGAGVRFTAPSEITLDAGGPEPWEVHNAGDRGYGTLTLAEATVNSVNTVYAQAVLQVGPEVVADTAKALGVTTELDPNASIALGTGEISPLELATVYSTLSREGRRIDPFGIAKIVDRGGNVLYERDSTDGEQVIEPAVAATVSDVLSDVPRWGTATRAALDRPMAAKTGTTQRNADAWLAGYTPEYTAVVWVGNAENNEAMDTVDGVRVYGGSIPAMIWHDFMAEALSDVPPTEFPEPDSDLLSNTGRVEFVVGDRPALPTTTTDPPETSTSTSSTASTSSTTSSSTTTTEPGGDGSTTTTTKGSTETTQSTTTTTEPSSTTTTEASASASGDTSESTSSSSSTTTAPESSTG